MPVRSWRSRGRPSWRGLPTTPQRRTVRPHLEFLEARCLLSAPPQPLLEHEPNNTLDQAQALGNLPGRVEVLGSIGGAQGNADIDWYSFTLTAAARISLSATPKANQAGPVLSLYNSDPNDFADPFDPFGHRLLAQAQGGAGTAALLTDSLAAGTYYVAVTGAGNRWFDPFLAGSSPPRSTASLPARSRSLIRSSSVRGPRARWEDLSVEAIPNVPTRPGPGDPHHLGGSSFWIGDEKENQRHDGHVEASILVRECRRITERKLYLLRSYFSPRRCDLRPGRIDRAN